MISSTSQPLPWRICGLFDSGFAGDAADVTSPGLNAHAESLTNFGVLDTSLGPAVSGVKDVLEKTALQPEEVADSWFNELGDFSADPLGDDSMEAFVNLDQFLNGNSFFDEDGNMVPFNSEGKEAEVTPVIDFGGEIVNENFNTANLQEVQDFLLPVEEQLTTPAKLKASRKRSAAPTTKSGLKTSLYEIPATGSEQVLSDTDLDHDYSAKKQRMSDPSEYTPCTSSTVTQFKQITSCKDIPETVASYSTATEQVVVLDNSMDKQTIRRIKNNYASKRSREQRKQKLSDMDIEAQDLESRNDELRDKIVRLEQLAKEMKAALVARMARH